MDSGDEAFNKKLILLIESLPHLWDKSIAEYKDKRMRENAWKSLGRRLNVSAADVERRWKAIRDRFARIERLNNNIPSGASSSQALQNSWNLYSSLNFLIPHVQTRKSIGNISKSSAQRTTFASEADDVSEQEGQIEYLDEDVLEYLNTQDSLNYNADQPKTNPNMQASKRLSNQKCASQSCQDENVHPAERATDRNVKQSDNPPRKRSKKTTEHLENEVISVLKNVQETFAETNISMKQDVEWNFCMSLYGSLKKMTKRQQKYCKFQISKLLFDLESESD